MMKQAHGATYYVDAKAKTAGTGSQNKPFSTIREATEILKPGDVCMFREGVYRETVMPVRSGTSEAPIVFVAHKDETVVITGCDPIYNWEQDKGEIYYTKTDMDLGHENQVFADGSMMWEARWPNAGGNTPEHLLQFRSANMGEGTTPTRIVDTNLPERDWSGARVWVASHKRWFCWTGRVTDHGKGYVSIENNADKEGNQVCKPKGQYYLFGTKTALDSENEWYFDENASRLYVWVSGGGAPSDRVEIKRRQWAFDLRGMAHIHIRNVAIVGASLATDDKSEHHYIDGCRVFYPYHSSRAESQYGSQVNTGIVLNGESHVVCNCEIAFTSGSGLVLAGRDCQVFNNYIHDCNYIGSYAAPLVFARGCSGHVASHNTIARSGRSCINTKGFYDCLLQYNDVGYAGYLTFDLGLTYGNGVEGGNSEIRYNWFHNNVSKDHNMGLYFDHGCKNIIIHHNVILAGSNSGMMNNQYANYILYYNNTVSGKGLSYRSDWAAAQEKDLYGCRLFNNVGTSDIRIEGMGIVIGSNSWKYTQLVEHKYLTSGSEPVDSGVCVEDVTGSYIGKAPDRGAYELGGGKWQPGHDFSHPPEKIDIQRSKPLHRNLLRNSAFYNGKTTGWKIVGNQVAIVEDFHSQWVVDGKAMMGGYSISLGKGENGIRQLVKLDPDTTYELMGMFRVDGDAKAFLEVNSDNGGRQRSTPVLNTDYKWQRRTVRFTTGPQQKTVIVMAKKSAEGNGIAYIDDMGLQRQD